MRKLRLGEVITIERGKTYKSALIGMDGPVLLGLGSIQRNGGFRGDSLRTYGGDSPEKMLVKPGQLYASLKDVTQSADLLGAVARVPASGPVGRLTQDTVRLDIVDDSVPPDYLYWVLRTPHYRQYCRSHLTGTTNLGLPREDFLAYEFPAPTPQLIRLTDTLGAIDDKIESNRRRIDTASQLAKALFDEAVSGRESVLAADVMGVRMGSAFKGDFFTEPGLGRPLLRIRDLKTFTSQVWTTEQRDDEVVIQPGDIVVGMDAEFRATLWLGEASLLNQRVCSFVGADHVGRAYVLHALAPELSFMEAAKTGTTVIHLNKSDIAAFRAPALTVDEHRGLADSTEPLIELIVASASENRKLESLRDVLLPELLSGRIRVPEAEQAMTGVGA